MTLAFIQWALVHLHFSE